ncbi:MAG: GNAT family N-acetyltransferase [Oscillospiraceae bacterium]|nr:GNAT family N-acetyltransferase [Oscillospiraceae bacterium]
MSCSAFGFWRAAHNAPYHFPMDEDIWFQSLHEDIDSDGRKLFDHLTIRYSRTAPSKNGEINGMIVYGETAFGFDHTGEISNRVHHKIIRDICFPENAPEIGQKLLAHAISDFGTDERIHAFFHYFGMSTCARHGKLHESASHVHELLLKNGFIVEHENVYYAKYLTSENASAKPEISLLWKEESPGHCREFTASMDDREVGWGQIHFLPQGDIAYLRWVYIEDKLQHQGIGTRTMKALFCSLYAMGIRRFDTDTALSNIPAQHYYEKCGFSNEGITRSYFTA